MDVIKQHGNQLPYELTNHIIYLKNIKKDFEWNYSA